MSVPTSRVEEVSLGRVGDILREGLTRYQLSQEEGLGYLLEPTSLTVTGETKKEWEEGMDWKTSKENDKKKRVVYICWANQV